MGVNRLQACRGRPGFDVRPPGDAEGEDIGRPDFPAEGREEFRNALAADEAGDDEPGEDIGGRERSLRQDARGRRDEEDGPIGQARFR